MDLTQSLLVMVVLVLLPVEMVKTLFSVLELLYIWLLLAEVLVVQESEIRCLTLDLVVLVEVVLVLGVTNLVRLEFKHHQYLYPQTPEHMDLEMLVNLVLIALLVMVAVVAVALVKLEALMMDRHLQKDKVEMENNIQRLLVH
jgi:hypothetical protein